MSAAARETGRMSVAVPGSHEVGATARFLAFVVGDVLRVRRAHVESAMCRAGLTDVPGLARAMYRSLARGLLELLAMAFTRSTPNVFVPREVLEIARKRGAVVATAHTGSWDVVACAVAAHVPLTVVTKRLSVRALDWIWRRIRLRRGVHLVEVGGAAREIRGALSRREVVVMMIDQAPERARGTIRVDFLGAPAWIDLAPALCAMRARVPLVAAFPVRRAGVNTIEVKCLFVPEERPSRKWAEEVTIATTHALAAVIRERPEQWLWMHRRWKDAPAGGRGPEVVREG